MQALLLPGMDGGGRLLDAFRARLPFASFALEYPPDRALGHDALEPMARAALARLEGPALLVAESFSGPIAIRIAASPPPGLAALVLVSTFARAPAPAFLRSFVHPALFSLARSRALLRLFLVGADAPHALVEALRAAIAEPAPAVLAARVREVLRCDVRRELARITLPTLCLRGTRDRLVRHGLRGAGLRRERLDAPHLVLQTRPAESAAIVRRFLAESGLA